MKRPLIDRRRFAVGAAVLPLAVAAGGAEAARAEAAVRKRESFNSGWRFQQGDPDDGGERLQYDVRPAITTSADGKVADAQPDAAQAVDSSSQPTLKAWILPTANAFIKDPAARHARPDGDPGGDVSWVRPEFDDSGWAKVDLPHDWAIAGPFLTDGPYGGMGRLKTWGPAWYRKTFEVSAADKGRSLFLDIDGAMSYATVWLNGRLVGGWPYGYASWRLDLTPYVAFGGRNSLAIRLDNPPESARWYPGAGLYRNVWLTTTNPVHVGQWGSFITMPQVSAEAATVKAAITIDNDGTKPQAVTVTTRLYPLDAKGAKGALAATIATPAVDIAPKSSATVTGQTTVAKPRLWGPPPDQTPNRYIAVTEVRAGGKVVDQYETTFGIRSLTFDPDVGVLVNGRHVPLNGTNNHHDLGALGAAFNVRAAERQLDILAEMGCNALRMSHNPPAPELLDLADAKGFLVLDEIFDVWYRNKTPLDFHLIFPDWHEPDLRAMIRRDRNHPSIIMWSVGNEVGEQYTDADGAEVGRKLVAIAHDEDATRPTMTAMNWAKADMPLPAVVDTIALNYQGAGVRTMPGQFPAFRAKFPGKVIFSSESASALSSRGCYQFPVPGAISASVRPGAGGDDATHQVSSYELFAADFGSTPDRAWAAQDQNGYVAGEFVWTGFDYLGEPTPYYTARSSYSGIVDLAGFPKDRFYLYQSRWRPDLAMAHILPHWTWPGREGSVTPVHVFTSGDEAELFVNGVSQGRQKKAPYAYRLRWDYVVYQPGDVTVQAYRNGQPWAQAKVQTASQPARLTLTPDRAAITGDGLDLSYVTAAVFDAQGVAAPVASNLIRFSIDGPGEIVATDNGDATDFTPFPSPQRKAFNGLALAIVRAKPGGRGAITVRAQSDGLPDATTVLKLT